MSDSELPTNQCNTLNNPEVQRKHKYIPPNNLDLVHSSLEYTSFKAPPIVEYKSVDSYCEKKVGKSLLPSKETDGSSICDISNIKSISSPIVIKSPNKPTISRPYISSDYDPPYVFFSIEELSTVKSLSHWSNNKICPVGRIQFDAISQEYFLHSVMEKGCYKVLLDLLLLAKAPKLNLVLQIFGNIEVAEENPVIKIHFYRNLGSADVKLFENSYRIMQKRMSGFFNSFKINIDHKPEKDLESEVACELNDTLDDYNFSVIEKTDEKGEVQATIS